MSSKMSPIIALAGFADTGDNSEFERQLGMVLTFLFFDFVALLLLTPILVDAMWNFKTKHLRAVVMLAIESNLLTPWGMILFAAARQF